jgi:hypothetical protein
MKPQGVLDEMGFLVLLGAISDRLYPGRTAASSASETAVR